METENRAMIPNEATPEKPRKKKSPSGALIVFLVYAVVIVAFGVCLSTGLNWLEDWLTDYEAAQPKVRCQQVYEDLFARPDWKRLYAMAGTEDTAYESAEHYAVYMQAKVGSEKLSYSETSAGLSGDHKYIVKLKDEKIAEFTLTTEDHTVTDIPEWKLGSVSIFFSRQEDVRICTAPENRVFINGVELTQEHTVKTMDTDVEPYLPEGIHGLRRRWVYEEGFLVRPQVSVVNTAGEQVALVYDKSSNTYLEPLPEETMSPEQEEVVLEAAKAYCRFMAHALGPIGLSRYFDPDSEIYAIVTDAETWMLFYKDYRFEECTFSDYYRYSDTLYSVKVNMSFFGTGSRNTEKEFPVDSTFLMEQKENGEWLVVDMLNVDVQKQNVKIRMRYLVNGQILEDQMVDSTTVTLTPPAVHAPEGKRFAGWYLQRNDENGNTTYSLAFVPDESGNVHLSQEVGQEEITLHALFEKAD